MTGVRRLSRAAASLSVCAVLVVASCARAQEKSDRSLPEKQEIRVTSSLDGTRQPGMLWVPPREKSEPAPLLVRLHSWSYGYRQANTAWFRQAVERDWIYLHPDFRGRNDDPQACGSKFARQDVLDAIDWVVDRYQVDESRIYLCGVSGGGHMTMLMAGYHPERFSAASAWVGISDLAAWHRFHTRTGTPSRYAKMIAACCGGPPGSSKAVDAEYRARSPLFHLANVGDLPLDLNAGVKDGKDGSVPIHHTLNAFNVVAKAQKRPEVSDTEIEQLWESERLSHPRAGENEVDPLYGREVRLRRKAGRTRVTIFQGGHEGIARAACEWMSQFERKTRSPSG